MITAVAVRFISCTLYEKNLGIFDIVQVWNLGRKHISGELQFGWELWDSPTTMVVVGATRPVAARVTMHSNLAACSAVGIGMCHMQFAILLRFEALDATCCLEGAITWRK